MSQNLIPTSRTDKNGVTVVRHLKPESSSASPDVTKKNFPSPGSPTFTEASQERLEERQQLRNQIFDLAQAPEGQGPNRPDKLAKTLSVIHDSEYLQRALEVAHAINDSNSDPQNYGHEWHNFAEGLRKRKAIEVGYRNLDLIRKGDRISNGYWAIVELHSNLASRWSITEPDSVERMDNHLFAYNAVVKHPGFGDARDWEKYADEYAPLVIKHPDHCEQLCSYLKERGGPTNFNEEGFTEYLDNAVPLAGGTL
jgi:hypothetical protein